MAYMILKIFPIFPISYKLDFLLSHSFAGVRASSRFEILGAYTQHTGKVFISNSIAFHEYFLFCKIQRTTRNTKNFLVEIPKHFQVYALNEPLN